MAEPAPEIEQGQPDQSAGVEEPSSRTICPVDAGKPLMILELKQDSSEVTVNHEALDIVMKELKNARAEVVSVISVMGMFRTGKSFLLGFLLRFLRKKMMLEEEMRKAAQKEVSSEEEFVDVLDEFRKEEEEFKELDAGDYLVLKDKLHSKRDSWRFAQGDKKSGLPPWVFEVNDTHLDAKDHFAWRGGKDRCTQGIWLWSHPFVYPDKNGRRVAVLLMDTQGAWDGQMTKAQSATIFGLTALLSSKLIYNVKMQCSENEFDNLDYITTFTQTVCNDLPGRKETPFGQLQVLVRDWQNFEDGWTVDQCKAQMKEHLDDHLGHDNVRDDAKEKVQRLKEVFNNVSCFGLPHPGLKVVNPKFDGSLDTIDPDFIQLLDEFTCEFFNEDFPKPSAPLGCEITADGFKNIVMNFAKTFEDQAQDLAIGLREAFVNVNLLTARDNILKTFRARIKKLVPPNTVVDPELLNTQSDSMFCELRDEFVTTIKPWKLGDAVEKQQIEELCETMNNDIAVKKSTNEAALEGAKLKILASPAVGCGGYFLLVHHWLLCFVGVIGGYMHFKKRATEQNKELTFPPDPVVAKSVWNDVQTWLLRRCADLQAIQIALSHWNPNEALSTLMKAASGIEKAAKAASSNEQPPPTTTR